MPRLKVIHLPSPSFHGLFLLLLGVRMAGGTARRLHLSIGFNRRLSYLWDLWCLQKRLNIMKSSALLLATLRTRYGRLVYYSCSIVVPDVLLSCANVMADLVPLSGRKLICLLKPRWYTLCNSRRNLKRQGKLACHRSVLGILFCLHIDHSRCSTTVKAMPASITVFSQGYSLRRIVTYPTNGTYPTTLPTTSFDRSR